MPFLNFAPEEKKLIVRVAIISAALMGIAVAGTVLFTKIQTARAAAEQHKKNDPLSSTQIQPFDKEAHQELAQKYMQSGAPEKAIPHLERIHALDAKNFQVTLELAHASLEAGNYREALEYYDYLIEKQGPDSVTPAACARRGIALFYLGKLEESASSLEACVGRFPRNAEAYCFLGQIEASRKLSSDKAAEYLQKSISLDSSYTEAWYQLARYYMQLKLYAKARDYLITALEKNPFHSKSHSRLGMVYYYLDYPELAKKSYETALIINPYDFNTYYNLAELLISALRDTIPAVENYKKALELAPHLYEAAFRLGLVCSGNGMTKEAIGYFERALEQVPTDTRILLQYAAAWEKLGQNDRALDCYKAILSYDELHAIARQKCKLLTAESGVPEGHH